MTKVTNRPSAPTRALAFATAQGTARYRDRFVARFAPDFFRAFGDGLTVSSIGLGTYLGECDAEDDARYTATIRQAIEHGVNVIDTAINYRCQRSEHAVGRALQAVLGGGVATREELVVCTKGGYVPLEGAPPSTRDEYQGYLRRSFYDAGIMAPEDVVAGGHCLAPGFLAHQIARSRANLGVAVIDLYYLHNPEQQLAVMPRDEFTRRLRSAFALLEERVARGEIARYGCATWNAFRVTPDSRDHLSLEALVALAREVGGDEHHFAAVQLPLNLAMTEAVRAPTQPLGGRLVPLLEAASELGIAVVASATLLQSKLAAGLPDVVREAFPALRTDAQRAIGFVRALPGITSALVGMKRVAHLQENLAAAAAA